MVLWFDVDNGISERIFFLGEFLDFTNDLSVCHPAVMFSLPGNHSERASFTEPSLTGCLDSLVIGNKDALRIGYVLKKNGVFSSFGKSVDSSLHTPSSALQTIDDLLTDARVKEKRKATSHY